jgi:hypothetical protein
MKSNPELEAILERSLRRQVNVRQLDKSFDAAVWARIEAEESKSAAQAPMHPAAAAKIGRWLFILNAVGIASVCVFLCVFLFQWLAGVQVDATFAAPSFQVSDQTMTAWATGFAGAALLAGFFYTPWGGRVRDEFF